MKKTFYVYKHVNKINGKIYVGITSNIKDRWSRNGKRYSSCAYFFKAIQKYGWNGFEHIVLESNLTEAEALKRESYWIQFYHSNDKNYGYNLTSGGEYFEFSEETKEKMSQSRQKYLEKENIKKSGLCLETGETFKSCSDVEKETGILKSQIYACCSHYPSAFSAHGLHWVFINELPSWTEEKGLEKIKEIELKRGGTEEQKQKAYLAKVTAKGKKVFCIELNKIFLSTREAARELNIDYSRIGKVCRGQAKTAGGYHWKYIEE